jgi:hypothetical protein
MIRKGKIERLRVWWKRMNLKRKKKFEREG